MHICIITSSFPYNPSDAAAAAGLFVKDCAAAVAEAGHHVTVVTQDKGPGEKIAPPGVSVHWFPWMGANRDGSLSSLKPYKPMDAVAMASLLRQGRKALEKLVTTQRPDHVLAMWAVPAGYLAKSLKRRHAIPYTTWCLGSDIWTYGRYPVLRRVVKNVLRQSDLRFADGITLAEDASRLAGKPCSFMPSSRRLDRSLIRPVECPSPSGAPSLPEVGDGLDNRAPQHVRAPCETDAERFRLLFIGRYAPVKGVDILLEAWAQYLRTGHRGHLSLFGGGPLEATVRLRASQPDLKGHVTVGGYADEATVVSSLDACDCLVIPSRMESIPVVLSDALQMRRPVIVSDVGDMGRLLQEHPAGLVVPPEKIEALSNAMVQMAAADRLQYSPHIEALAKQFDLRIVVQHWLDEICPAHGNSREDGCCVL